MKKDKADNKLPKKKIIPEKTQIKMFFIFGVAMILLIAIILVAVLEYVFVKLEVLGNFNLQDSPFSWVMMFAAISVTIGLGLTFILEKMILRPFNSLLDGMTRLSKGEFETRIDLGKVAGIKGISDKFNALAAELQKTEILRSDFVNNFSHEFKTPIVSISSLIALMKTDELSKEKQLQYLNVIEEEISRLADMTTNILLLTKIENQGILTDKTRFNLSEQIRTCILLFEKKWTKKELLLDVEFEEFEILANEDMLKQVWLNLIDNAIKFADKGSELKIAINKVGKKTAVSVRNTGEPISESDYEKIFNKFYQGGKDKTRGNGIGLSIVKHVVDLHCGKVSVESQGRVTTFTVIL